MVLFCAQLGRFWKVIAGYARLGQEGNNRMASAAKAVPSSRRLEGSGTAEEAGVNWTFWSNQPSSSILVIVFDV